MIGIIGAMEEEVAALADAMEERRETSFAGLCFYSGTLYGKDAVVVRSGIGKVNMALCAQLLADKFHTRFLINTGVAGALDDTIRIGDIVIGTDALYHDMDGSALGDPPGQVSRMDVFSFPCDTAAAKLAAAINRRCNPQIQTHTGRVLTGDQVIANPQTKARIVAMFSGICCEMEGAAMAHVAYLNHIPCLIIRAISDNANQEMSMDYAAFEREAIGHTVRLLENLLPQL